jgi:hypothetical protein
MATDGPRFAGDFRLARERAELVLARETDRGLPYVGFGRLLLAEFFLGRWQECWAHGLEMRQVWQDDGEPRAGYLAPAAMALAAIAGYRRDLDGEREWSELADELNAGSGGSQGRNPLRDALRADVALWRGDREAAASHVVRPALSVLGPARSLYAATRAEVLGGAAMGEAEQLLGGNAFAEAILHRARGELDSAEQGFDECGARFHLLRTRLLRDPAHAATVTELRGLGVPPHG